MDDHRWERLEKQLRSMKFDQEEMLTHMRVGQESMMKRMEEISVEIKIHLQRSFLPNTHNDDNPFIDHRDPTTTNLVSLENSITQVSPKTDPIASPETLPPKINPSAPQTQKIQSLQLQNQQPLDQNHRPPIITQKNYQTHLLQNLYPSTQKTITVFNPHKTTKDHRLVQIWTLNDKQAISTSERPPRKMIKSIQDISKFKSTS
jgi:hypothetical protein